MADTTTIITGVADGAFEKAFNGLPPWATQKTAQEIKDLLKKSLDVQIKGFDQIKNLGGGGGGTLSPADIKKLNDELGKLTKEIKDQNAEAEKARKREKEEKDQEEDSLKRGKKKKAEDQAWLKLSGLLAGAGTKILTIQKQYFKTSEELFKSGINLVAGQKDGITSMQSLQQIVALTGLRLETFQKVVEKYSSSINAVGVNKFAKAVSQSITKLNALGYSSEQSAELIGTLVESESSYSDIRNKSSEQIAEDAERLGRQLTRLSLLTGQSAAQLQENLKALSKNTDSTVVSAVYGEEAAKRMNVFASSFKDADIGVMLQGLAAASAPEITKTFQSLAQAGEAPLAQEFTRIAQAARDGAITADQANRQVTAAAMKVNSVTLQTLQRNAAAGKEGAQETLNVITKLRQQGNTTAQATDKEVDAAIAAQASLSRFSTELEKTRSLGERTFPLLETQVDLATKALKTFNDAVIKTTDLFSAETRSWIGVIVQGVAAIVGLVSAVAPLIFGFKAVGAALLSLAAPVAVAVATFAAVYTLGTLFYDMISSFNWFNNMLDTVVGSFDHILKFIPGLSDGAKERIATREKVAAMSGPVTKGSTVATPKAPASTPLANSSATPPDGAKVTPQTGSATAAPAATPAVPPPPTTNDINSLIKYQSTLLAQLLESSQALVSVNKDILRITKARA